MLVHNYSKDNFIFVGSNEGIDSPGEPGVTLVPGYATLIVPPTPIAADDVAVFDEGTNTWSLQPSFIGQVGYNKTTKEETTITVVGAWPVDITLSQPLLDTDEWNAVSSEWETPLTTTVTFSLEDIDRTAEHARLRYITRGAGQAVTYQEKGDEATDYVAASYPADLTSYPFIQAEVNATGKTATQAADDILVQKSAWVALAAQIEEQRISGKIAVNAAIGEVAITTARDSAIAALDAI